MELMKREQFDNKKTDRVFNDKCVEVYLNVEKNKSPFDDTVAEEYHEKVTLYGYAIVIIFN